MLRCFIILLSLLLPLSAVEKLRVLMIGNSYTAQTRSEVKGFLDADPGIEVELVAHCPGGRKLVQHLASPKVDTLLRDDAGWDVVVLQEQSQLPAYAMRSGGAVLEEFTKGGEGMVRKVMELQPEARIMLFETWARHRDPDKLGTLKAFGGKPEEMQEALTKGYAMLRRNPGKWDFSKSVEIAPVGSAWLAWYQHMGYEDTVFKLHSQDHSHPGNLGAFLTGAVFYRAITGRESVGVAYRGKLVDAKLVAALKKQADEAH